MTNLTPTIVLDASVIINLLASGDSARLLKALGCKAVVPTQVVAEIARDPIHRPDTANSLAGLLESGLLHLHDLKDKHYLNFLDLVGAAPPDSLGDGEAATISAAEELKCMAIIDERKATRIARCRRAPHLTASTLDIYSSGQLELIYSRNDLAELVFSSMLHARMRVPADWRTWVIALIGEERALKCSCLPRHAVTN